MSNAQKLTQTPRASRRAFLRAAATAGVSSWLGSRFQLSAEPEVRAERHSTGSSVGSLYPFIQSQAVKGEFPLSFLNPRFRSLGSWKKQARAKLLDLLHYAPGQVKPAPETLERQDCGDYFREKV